MEPDFSLFKIEYNKVEPKKGRVLLSEPFLQDSCFKRSLVLLTEHNNEGSIGFVINKPLDVKVNDVMIDFPYCTSTVSIGGPVSTNTIHYLHTVGDLIPNSVHIQENVYWGGDFDALKEGLKEGIISAQQIRFFLGYSGWHSGQLDKELKQNSWIITEISANDLMFPSPDLWKSTMKKMGDKYKIWSDFPENPGQN